jgi:hypothetical protein
VEAIHWLVEGWFFNLGQFQGRADFFAKATICLPKGVRD